MRISALAIISKNRGLGFENKLLFHIPGELPRFKKMTMGSGLVGHPLIMGRKTFDSIGKPLPGRLNIVISRNAEKNMSDAYNNCVFVNSLENALVLAKNWEKDRPEEEQEIFIIGGGQIFKEALSITDRLYLTIVDAEVPADVFFPAYESLFTKVVEEQKMTDWEYPYEFVTLEK